MTILQELIQEKDHYLKNGNVDRYNRVKLITDYIEAMEKEKNGFKTDLKSIVSSIEELKTKARRIATKYDN